MTKAGHPCMKCISEEVFFLLLWSHTGQCTCSQGNKARWPAKMVKHEAKQTLSESFKMYLKEGRGLVLVLIWVLLLHLPPESSVKKFYCITSGYEHRQQQIYMRLETENWDRWRITIMKIILKGTMLFRSLLSDRSSWKGLTSCAKFTNPMNSMNRKGICSLLGNGIEKKLHHTLWVYNAVSGNVTMLMLYHHHNNDYTSTKMSEQQVAAVGVMCFIQNSNV